MEEAVAAGQGALRVVLIRQLYVSCLGMPQVASERARRTSRLTQAQEDYLNAIYRLGGRERMVSTSAVAQRLNVAAPSATERLGKLAGLGLVSSASASVSELRLPRSRAASMRGQFP